MQERGGRIGEYKGMGKGPGARVRHEQIGCVKVAKKISFLLWEQ